MTFNQQINSIQAMISNYNLSFAERQDHGLVQDVRGIVDGREIYICVRYATNTIYWRDKVSGANKTFNY